MIWSWRRGCLTWNQIFLPYEISGGCPVLKQTLNSVEALYVRVPVHFALLSTCISRWPNCQERSSAPCLNTHAVHSLTDPPFATLLLCMWRAATNAHRIAPAASHCLYQSGGRESYFNKCADSKVFYCQMWYCTITTVCNYWWHVSHVNCKTHASGAEHQLSVLYQSVCVFNSKPVLFVNLRVRVRDLVMTGSVLERVWECVRSASPGCLLSSHVCLWFALCCVTHCMILLLWFAL